MLLTMMKSKIHRATVTDADLEYEGSITIDKNLMEISDIITNEKVDVYNCNNGARFSTYVIPGEQGQICLNGAAARHVHRGDVVIIVSYGQMTREEAEKFEQKVILVDEKNQPKGLTF
ncbi:MAG: aspartate 1-decarboxylase [Bdellovibrionales bacterium]|nr:aspartate 1-decarboxylase [Bdellovibrionales bacterium]NQZ18052.1 aspartate 1-decarboxylase [Bdellovibrionales bacterium]